MYLMTKNHVKIRMLLLAAVVMCSLAACGTEPKEPAVSPDSSVTGPASPDEKASGDEKPPAEPPKEESPAVKEGEGSFTGLADSHTVEIIVDGQPMSFQFGEALGQAMESMKPQQTVAFTYEEKTVEGETGLMQRVLKEIHKAEASDSGQNGSTGPDLPPQKQLEVTLEGNREQRSAKLVTGEGYAFYMFEQFSFDKTKDRLSMKVYPHYQVRIEKLQPDFNLDHLAQKGGQELEKHGKVTRLKGDEMTETMRDARLFLISRDAQGMHEYIVKEINGNGYAFHVDIPQGEASEGFAPLAFVSLNTLQPSN